MFKCQILARRCLNHLCGFLLYSTAKIIITFISLSAIQNIIHFIFQFETTHVHSCDLQLEGTGAEEHNFYLLPCRSHYRFRAKEDNEMWLMPISEKTNRDSVNIPREDKLVLLVS